MYSVGGVMISAVCSIAVELVTTTWRSGQPNGPKSSSSRGSRSRVTSSARRSRRCGAAAGAQAVTATAPTVAEAERSFPAAKE